MTAEQESLLQEALGLLPDFKAAEVRQVCADAFWERSLLLDKTARMLRDHAGQEDTWLTVDKDKKHRPELPPRKQEHPSNDRP